MHLWDKTVSEIDAIEEEGGKRLTRAERIAIAQVRATLDSAPGSAGTG